MTLSDATTPGQSGPRRDGNERVFCVPQISSFTGTLFCVITRTLVEGVLHLCRVDIPLNKETKK